MTPATVANPSKEFFDYLLALNFLPDDVVCVGCGSDKRKTKEQREWKNNFAPYNSCLEVDTFDQLTEWNQNGGGLNLYISMATFLPDTTTRKKERVAAIRHVFVDADFNGAEVAAKIESDIAAKLIPRYSVKVETSPGKFQFIWNVQSDDFLQDGKPDIQKHEALLDRLRERYQTDPATTDTARVLRLPGFQNVNYDDRPVARLVCVGDTACHLASDFKIAAILSDKPATTTPDMPWLTDNPIPYGEHDRTLFRIASKWREQGLDDADVMAERLIDVCEKRCIGYGSDYREMCQAKAEQAMKYAIGTHVTVLIGGKPAGSGTTENSNLVLYDDPAVVSKKMAEISARQTEQKEQQAERLKNWRSEFRTVQELESGNVKMVIDNFLPEGNIFIGALPSETKTLFALSIAKALTTGKPLLSNLDWTVGQITPVIYMIPESSGRAFRQRCTAFGIPSDERLFLCRTISEGATLRLDDPILQEAVRTLHPVVILDTVVRFSEADNENDAAQNKKLANDMITLRQMGAVVVLGLHHATKALRTEAMTQENVLRGTGDLAALADAVYGLRRDDKLYADNAGPLEVEVRCVKPRDIKNPPAPFRIAASRKVNNPGQGIVIGIGKNVVSVIDETGDFQIVRQSIQQARVNQQLEELVTANPNITLGELASETGQKYNAIQRDLKRLGWTKPKGVGQQWTRVPVYDVSFSPETVN